nr:MAG TPA: hypothetical protein [Caudoviricetes sp.]
MFGCPIWRNKCVFYQQIIRYSTITAIRLFYI